MKTKDIIIEAVRARIDHPEDWVWRNGSRGYDAAISALDYSQNNTNDISLKYDGTPSLIFGRNSNGQLVVTDKSGFGAKKYNGHPVTPTELYQMLYSRKPAEEGRKEYATMIASLWPMLDSAVPKTTRGYYQGDLLYVGTPKLEENYFTFKPNKVEYKVLATSSLGNKIANSKAGIVVHSFFKNENQEVPDPLTDVSDLQQSPNLFVMSANMQDIRIPPVSPPKFEFDDIDNILNPMVLKSKKISNFPQLIGSYINKMAVSGKEINKQSPADFLKWLPLSNTTVEKQDKIIEFINENKQSYVNLWKAILIVTKFKNIIKNELDNNQGNDIIATLNNEPNHEGYVVSTPSGKIKLVDRYKYMAKQQVDQNENK